MGPCELIFEEPGRNYFGINSLETVILFHIQKWRNTEAWITITDRPGLIA